MKLFVTTITLDSVMEAFFIEDKVECLVLGDKYEESEKLAATIRIESRTSGLSCSS